MLVYVAVFALGCLVGLFLGVMSWPTVPRRPSGTVDLPVRPFTRVRWNELETDEVEHPLDEETRQAGAPAPHRDPREG